MMDRNVLRTGAAMLRTAIAGAGFILAARTMARLLARGDGAATLHAVRERLARLRHAVQLRLARFRRGAKIPASTSDVAEERAP